MTFPISYADLRGRIPSKKFDSSAALLNCNEQKFAWEEARKNCEVKTIAARVGDIAGKFLCGALPSRVLRVESQENSR